MVQEHRPFEDAPRGSAKAIGAIFAILVVTTLVVFSARQFWHEEQQDADPASVSAPDTASRGEGTAPLDPTAP